jgi:uncharacterized protein (DUF1330 family)
MPAYLVGTVKITDADRFSAYSAAIRGLSAKFGGESVVAGQIADVLEGGADPAERVVVTRFPSEADARAYLACDDYVAAKIKRTGAATVVLRLLVV